MAERSEKILSNLGGIAHNNLVNIVDIDTNELTEMPPSLYYEMEELKKLSNATGANRRFFNTQYEHTINTLYIPRIRGFY